MSDRGKSIVRRTWFAIQTIGLLSIVLVIAVSTHAAFAQSRPLESRSAEELKAQAQENAEALTDNSLRLAERIDRLSQQIVIYRRLMQHREALRAGLVYHEIIRRNGRNTDLLKSALSISEDLLALNQAAKAEKLLTETLAGIGGGPLDPITELAARAKLAGLAQQAGREALAAERWLAVEISAEKALRLIDQRVLPGKDRAFCVTSLATAIAARGEPKKAIGRLTEWLAQQADDDASLGVEEMHVEIARHYALLRDDTNASKYLSFAIGIHRKRAPDDPAIAGLYLRQAAVLTSAGQQDQADRQYELAIDSLANSLPAEGDPAISAVNAEQWRWLCEAYRHSGRYRDALPVARELVAFYEQALGADHPATADHREVLGTLYSAVGRYRDAFPLLTETVARLRKQQPPEPLALATALINLGAAEMAFGEYADCRTHFMEAWKLRQEHLNEDDPQLAAVLNAVANLEVAEGHFAEAIQLYRRALQIFADDSRFASKRSDTLLNLAMAYRSQHQYDTAIGLCREALLPASELRPLARASKLNALASLHRLRGRLHDVSGRPQQALEDYQHASRYSQQALEICHDQGASRHAEAAGAASQLASISQRFGDDGAAEEHWREAAEIYHALGQRGAEAQIRNSLGVMAYARHDDEAAHREFQQALQLLPHGSFRPQLRYSTLCNLAAVLDRQARRDEAVALLTQAVAIVETPRAGYLGDERQLAEFFSRFAHAFDLLFAWHVESNDLEAAIALSERARNRTLLDRMQLAGVDLLETLPAEDRATLREQQAELRRELNAIRALAAAAVDPQEQAEAEAAYRGVQRKYADLWEQVRNASPVYRQMIARGGRQVPLKTLRQQLANDLMLIYYIGSQQSYVIAVDRDRTLATFELNIPETQADLATAASKPEADDLAETRGDGMLEDQLLDDLAQRGLIGTVASEKGERIQASPLVTQGPFTRASAEPLVAAFRRSLENRFSSGTNDAGSLLSRIVLPEKLLQLIRDREPEHLIVIRDGPLRRLPWEALPVGDEGDTPRYVLDELPPIAYVPSASVLNNLTARRASSEPAAGASLLSIGNPAYSDRAVAGFGAKLPPLPGTAEECRRIAERFRAKIGAEQAAVLQQADATEGNFLAAVAGRKYLHIAAHGLIDQRHDNLFGAIALTPPVAGEEAPANDGFLEVREIQSLPLSACELAILSACQTNVGARRPLEAGPSLAQAFLLGGARRVTASHWNVSDSSTAELMSIYMEHVLDQAGTDRKIDYAAALRAAKQAVRAQPKWRSPYYWSAFVLVGPAD